MTGKQLLTLIFASITITSASASDVVSEREAGFKASKRAVSAIKEALAEGNMAVVAASANSMAEFAERIPGLFPPGSKGGFFSAAKEGIWRSFPDFVEKSRSFQDTAQALATLAASPSPDKVAVDIAFTKVMEDCKACHRSYKKGW